GACTWVLGCAGKDERRKANDKTSPEAVSNRTSHEWAVVRCSDLSFQGSLAAQRRSAFEGADSCPTRRVGRRDLPCSYFNRTRKLFFSGMISILSSRASHPKPKLKSSPDPLTLFFSWASVCGPTLESACQTFPAVSPTWLLM